MSPDGIHVPSLRGSMHQAMTVHRMALVFLILSLAACGPPARTVTPLDLSGVSTAHPVSGLITREQAIDIAVKSASMSRPEVSAALVPPSNVQARQMTLSDAWQRQPGGPSIVRGYDPQTPVWYVTLDGLWENQMPAPGVTVTPGYYHHAGVILDARTGMEISTWMMP